MEARFARHRAVSEALARLPDAALLGQHLGAGIGGSTARLDVDGVPVFVKRILLTGLERAHPHSTANLFELPAFYQYGVGSAGFGVWRELAAHQRATDWVLSGRCESFPLLHHWRIVEQQSEARPVEEMVAYWDGHPAVRKRLEALGTATACVLLFLEYVPFNLNEWFVEGAFDWVDDRLRAAVDFLNAAGMVHFDAHPRNVLCDGERLYVTDFGLALDAAFDLSTDESLFLASHQGFDRQNIERYLAPWASDRRYDQVAGEMNDFYARLVAGPKSGVGWAVRT
jgi:hypothetical protein